LIPFSSLTPQVTFEQTFLKHICVSPTDNVFDQERCAHWSKYSTVDTTSHLTTNKAGGNLGPSILTPFLKSSFNVTVLSRPTSKSTFPSEAHVIKTDYSPDSLASAFKGQDAVISIVGNEGFAEQAKIIDAAVRAGVKRFIPSEFGSDTASETVRGIVPIFNGKKQVVDYLKSKESDTFSWTALITGPFFDWVSINATSLGNKSN